jgi:glycosyltransferase involved in cell wall biosynthesis
MHILIVTNSFSRIQLFNFARILSKDHTISAVSFERSFDSRSKGKETCYGDCRLVPLEKRSVLTTALKSILSLKPYCLASNYSALFTKSIEEFVCSHKPDVVIFDQFAMGQYHTHVNGVPKIFYPVDAQSRQKQQRYGIEPNPFKRLLYYLDYLMVLRYENKIYNAFEHLFLASAEDAAYTRRTCEKLRARIHVVSSGVDLDFYHPADENCNPGEPSIIFFGNLSTVVNEQAVLWFYKNVWLALKAEVRNLKWYIVGTAPRDAVKKLSAEQDIVVTGYVDDYRPYIWDATVFISPLIMGTGMKNKVLQAMAMGKTVVATPLSIEGISAEHNKHLLVADDAESFKNAVLLLLNDRRLAVRLGAEARKMVEQNYPWQKIAENFIKVVASIVEDERYRLSRTPSRSSRLEQRPVDTLILRR